MVKSFDVRGKKTRDEEKRDKREEEEEGVRAGKSAGGKRAEGEGCCCDRARARAGCLWEADVRLRPSESESRRPGRLKARRPGIVTATAATAARWLGNGNGNGNAAGAGGRRDGRLAQRP